MLSERGDEYSMHEKERNSHKISVGKSEGKRALTDLGVDGK
jgi:hypothetical protein